MQPGTDRTAERAASERTPEPPTVHVRRRLTVSEAAGELGISAEAVRSRIKRGTLKSAKEGGTVYILMHAPADDQSRPGTDQSAPEHDRTNDGTAAEADGLGDRAALVESLEDQVSYLREQLDAERNANRENRRLLAAALERIPAIESPRDKRGSPEADPEPGQGVEEDPADGGGFETAAERPWWRRWLGG